MSITQNINNAVQKLQAARQRAENMPGEEIQRACLVGAIQAAIDYILAAKSEAKDISNGIQEFYNHHSRM